MPNSILKHEIYESKRKLRKNLDPLNYFSDKSLIESLPLKALMHIFSFFTLKTLVRLRKVSHSFKVLVALEYQKYAGLYQRLLKIEPTLAPVLPNNNYIEAYKKALDYVKTRQKDEVEYIDDDSLTHSFTIVDKSMSEIEVLEQQSQKLDEFNSNFIKQHIDLDSSSLDLSEMGITRIPNDLFEAKEYNKYWSNLKYLDISNNSISNLPSGISKCQSLEYLHCNINEFSVLPESLGNFRKLKFLGCGGNPLNSLPMSIGNCAALEYLDCNGTDILFLPDTLGNCRALKILDCYYSSLYILPKSLANCQALEIINCFEANLTSLPETLVYCESLKVVDCQNNKIAVLPEFYMCKSLEILKCKGNPISSLPASIGNCRKLKELDCSNTLISFFPKRIEACQALEILYCDNANLSYLPANLGECKALKDVSFRGNQLAAIPRELVAKLGNDWARETMNHQQRHTHTYPDVAFNEVNSITHVHTAIKRKECEASSVEKQSSDIDAVIPPNAKKKP